MHFEIRRVESTLKKPVLSTTWLSDCRLLFLEYKPIGRAFVGRVSGQWGGVLYLTVTSEPDLLIRENRLKELAPGLYIDICDDAKLHEDPTVDFKRGIREIHEFLRRLQTKRVRQDREDEWRIRSCTLREIFEVSDRIDAGMYEIIVDKSPHVYTRSEDIADEVAEQSRVQAREAAAERISIQDGNLFVEHMDKFRQHALRTREIDIEKLTKRVEEFYQVFGFTAPPVVVLPNPLSTAVAGNFATVLRYNEKFGKDSSDSLLRNANADLFSKYVNSLVSRAASWSTQQSLDDATSRAVREFVERRTVANRFSDDSLRFLRNNMPRRVPGDFVQVDTSYTNPDTAIDTKYIYDALDSVLSEPTKFARPIFVPGKKSTTAERVRDMAKRLSRNDRYVEQLLLWFSRAGEDILLEQSVQPLVSFGMSVLKLNLPVYEIVAAWENLMLEAAGIVVHRDFCFVSNFPEFIQTDDRSRLHCSSGPAIKWRDGWHTYSWHGVEVPPWLIDSPEKITIETINAASNQEFRRVMIEMYGLSRYLLDSGAAEVQRDKFGVLYSQWIDQGEPLTMVRVTNSTPEPDGSVKEYFLRVPPTVRTAEEGVAWTFGFNQNEYNPIIET